MPGIYVAAIIVTLLAASTIGTMIYFLSKRQRKHLWLAFFTLPFCALMYLLVRKPVLNFVAVGLHGSAILLGLLNLALGPATEEGSKLLPLLIPKFRRWLIDRRTAILIALSLGLGFGIGEAWFVAWSLLKTNPEVARLPFYLLGGYITERWFVCFFHGVFTSIAATGLVLGWEKGILYYLWAVLIHAATNSTVYLLRFITSKFGEAAGQASYSIIFLIIIIGLGTIFFRLMRRAQPVEKISILSQTKVEQLTEGIIYQERPKSGLVWKILVFPLLFLPRQIQILKDGIKIKGLFYNVNIPFENIEGFFETPGYRAYASMGIRLAASSKGTLEIRQKFGLPYIISVSDRAKFLFLARKAKQAWEEHKIKGQ